MTYCVCVCVCVCVYKHACSLVCIWACVSGMVRGWLVVCVGMCACVHAIHVWMVRGGGETGSQEGACMCAGRWAWIVR